MGSRLKQLRIAAGLDIKEVALRTGKTYQYIWKIEEGVNEPPTWELLAKFADLYKCSVDSLLGLEGEELQRLTIDEGIEKLFAIIERLPKYRQRDLLDMAETFAARSTSDDREVEAAIFDRLNRTGGKEFSNLLLDFLDSIDDGGDIADGSTTRSDK